MGLKEVKTSEGRIRMRSYSEIIPSPKLVSNVLYPNIIDESIYKFSLFDPNNLYKKKKRISLKPFLSSKKLEYLLSLECLNSKKEKISPVIIKTQDESSNSFSIDNSQLNMFEKFREEKSVGEPRILEYLKNACEAENFKIQCDFKFQISVTNVSESNLSNKKSGQDSSKKSGTLFMTKIEVPKLIFCLALIIFILNMVFPGLGTILLAFNLPTKSSTIKTSAMLCLIGVLQFLTFMAFIGWTWSIMIGVQVLSKSKKKKNIPKQKSRFLKNHRASCK